MRTRATLSLLLTQLLLLAIAVRAAEDCSKWAKHSSIASLTPRVQSLLGLLSTWRQQHDIAAIKREADEKNWNALCSRRFVANGQFDLGCNLFGNHYSAATSALFAAVVLNRTMIINGDLDPDETVASTCQGSLSLRPWVVTRKKLEPLLEMAGCNNVYNDPGVEWWKKAYNFVTQNPSSKDDPGVTRQCGYARSKKLVLVFDDLFNSAVELFHKNQFLSQDARRRTELLLSNPAGLDMARFESYGLLLRSFVGVTNQTVELAKAALDGVAHRAAHAAAPPHECFGTGGILPLPLHDEQFFTIGVHLRHKRVDPALEQLYDLAAEKGLVLLKNQHAEAGKKCVILVASDRAAAIRHIQTFGATMDCQVRFIERNFSATITERQSQEHYEETGPWAEARMSIADWFLLSHSSLFFGTADSTFSFLIANQVAARAALRSGGDSTPTNTFLWAFPPSPLLQKPPESIALDKHWQSSIPPTPDKPGVAVMEHTLPSRNTLASGF